MGYRTNVDKTDGQDYTDRLARLQNLPWKRVLNVQAPYRWNVRRIFGDREVLDVGCGIGRNLKHLEPNGVGVDHNPHSVQTCRDMGLTAFTTDEFFDTEYAKPGRFGGMLAAHLVVHMPRPDAVEILRGYVDFLAPGGLLVLICPQERGYASDPTHETFTTGEDLVGLAHDVGLRADGWRSFPLPRAAGRAFLYNEFNVLATKPG